MSTVGVTREEIREYVHQYNSSPTAPAPPGYNSSPSPGLRFTAGTGSSSKGTSTATSFREIMDR